MDKMKDSTATGASGVTGGGGGASGSAGGGGGGGEGGGGTGEGDEFHSEFYNTGRIGRRNALPDILGSHCTTTTADLPTQMGALSTAECSNKPPNTSVTGNGTAMMSNNPANTTARGGS
ncbi:voltage-dependent calcium channel gamma-8 subunit-like isoform X2 [Topomyia yanbarensis]|nr:voltage-dependent calcium channel gamma-8 subunit-like isoform X2 [Topomyia yanbarensis]XP_058822731.1 voltage-dependent calcium channel gamma-8 subunit-like isoform X2 [Topomyia yanbarensis]